MTLIFTPLLRGWATLKAVVFHEHGGTDKLRYEERPEPPMGPDDVLVRVRACALNYLDLWARSGLRRVAIPLPHISGSDIAGEVVKVGRHVEWVHRGDRVLVSPGISCGHCVHCLAGQDNFCQSYEIIGYRVDGGYAEFVVVPGVNILPHPRNLSFEEGAAVPLVFLTAWHMLVSRAGIGPGEDVLVIGAGSGVGSAALQIAKMFGCRVIATAGSEEKLHKARALGADETINHTSNDILDGVKKLTDRRGVNVVVEHVGTATWEKSVLSLAPGGRLVTCGATTGFNAQLDLRYVYSRQLSLLGSYMGSKGELATVLRHVEKGRLRAVVDRVFPLSEAAKAQQLMEARQHFGKLVLRV